MVDPEDALALDRLIHEPTRLAILTVLSTTRGADFVFVQRARRLTNGNLSSHLTKLEAGGRIEVEQSERRRTPASRTAQGRERGQRSPWEQRDRLEHPSVRPDPAG